MNLIERAYDGLTPSQKIVRDDLTNSMAALVRTFSGGMSDGLITFETLGGKSTVCICEADFEDRFMEAVLKENPKILMGWIFDLLTEKIKDK